MLKTPTVSTSSDNGRPLLAPIDLAKFLRHRYVDPGSTFEPETTGEETVDPPDGCPRKAFRAEAVQLPG